MVLFKRQSKEFVFLKLQWCEKKNVTLLDKGLVDKLIQFKRKRMWYVKYKMRKRVKRIALKRKIRRWRLVKKIVKRLMRRIKLAKKRKKWQWKKKRKWKRYYKLRKKNFFKIRLCRKQKKTSKTVRKILYNVLGGYITKGYAHKHIFKSFLRKRFFLRRRGYLIRAIPFHLFEKKKYIPRRWRKYFWNFTGVYRRRKKRRLIEKVGRIRRRALLAFFWII